jgi:DNA-binding NarL/FixJ family response regulator
MTYDEYVLQINTYRLLTYKLTPRQKQVLKLIAAGMINKEIAAELGISYKTVEKHRSAAITALGAKSGYHAVAIITKACIE